MLELQYKNIKGFKIDNENISLKICIFNPEIINQEKLISYCTTKGISEKLKKLIEDNLPEPVLEHPKYPNIKYYGDNKVIALIESNKDTSFIETIQDAMKHAFIKNCQQDLILPKAPFTPQYLAGKRPDIYRIKCECKYDDTTPDTFCNIM